MKYKLIAIIIFFFLVFPFLKVYAIPSLELAINDNLKECRTYQPLSNTSLPGGWKYHDYGKQNDKSTHLLECNRIGYTYNPEILKGKINSSYLAIVYTAHTLAILLLVAILIAYLKTKKKKILIALPIIIILYLMFFLIFTFNIG